MAAKGSRRQVNNLIIRNNNVRVNVGKTFSQSGAFHSVVLVAIIIAVLGMPAQLQIFQQSNTINSTSTSTTSLTTATTTLSTSTATSTSTSSSSSSSSASTTASTTSATTTAASTSSTTSPSTTIPPTTSASTTSASTTSATTTAASTSSTTTIAAPAYLNTTFTESGLPANVTWQVSLNGAPRSSTSPARVVFNSVGGSYNFSVSNILYRGATLVPSTQSGVLAAGSSMAISFTEQTSFSETGLPSNILWSVSYANQTRSALTPSNIVFNTSYGNYPLVIQGLQAGSFNYTPSPGAANFVSGSALAVPFASSLVPSTTSSSTTTMLLVNASADTLLSSFGTASVSGFSSRALSVVNALNSSQLNKVLSSARGFNISYNNSYVYVDYGNYTQNSRRVKAGQQLYYVEKGGNRNLSIRQVIVRKAVPRLNISVAGVTVSQPNKTYVIHYPIIDGKSSYTISPEIFSSLAANNTAQFTYSATIAGRVVASGAVNSSSVSKAFSYNIPANQAFSLTFDTSGNANYTGVDPVVIILPTNIIHYIPITFTNPSATDTAAPYDANVVIDALDNSIYETTSMNNIEFFDSHGSVLNSWMEGNLLNENQNALTNLNSVAQLDYWIELPQGISGSSTYSVYMGFAGNFVGDAGSAAANLMMDCAITGEAPQISVPYGSCDTGNAVFTSYWNFVGSTLPTGWHLGGKAGNVVFSNGLQFQGNSAVVNNLRQTANQILEAKIWIEDNEVTNTAGMAMAVAVGINAITTNALTSTGVTFGTGVGQFYSGIYASFTTGANSLVANQASPTNTFIQMYDSNVVMGITLQPDNAIFYLNGTVTNTITSGVPASTAIYPIAFGSGPAGSGAPFYVNWTRQRPYPPDGANPTISFGTAGNILVPNVLLIPDNIVYYIPITFTNPDPNPTAQPFEANFIFDAKANAIHENPSMNNIEFFNVKGAILNSWLEGNVQNENQNTLLNSVSQLEYWVQLPKGIPASSSCTIYIGFAGNLPSAQNNLLGGYQTGEAPQISIGIGGGYGVLDDGVNVFTNYWNFQGTSLPSGWNTPGARGSSAGNMVINNGILFTGKYAWANSPAEGIDQVTEAKIFLLNTVSLGGGFGLMGSGEGAISPQSNNAVFRNWLTFASTTAGDLSNGIYESVMGAGVLSGVSFNGVKDNRTVNTIVGNEVYGVSVQSNNAIFYLNGNVISTITTAANLPSTNPQYYIEFGAKSAGAKFYVNWTRQRPYPPGGALPTVSFGAGTTGIATTFTESGLPAGTPWSVTYGNYPQLAQAPSSIVYTTNTGNWLYSVPIVINGLTYTPSPSAGSWPAGNTLAITFTGSGGATCTVILSNTAANFGTVPISGNAPTANAVADTNGGTSPANILLDGTNWVSGGNNFFSSNTVWDFSSHSGGINGNTLGLATGNLVDTFNVIAPSQLINLFFGSQVPPQQATGTYTQTITIENKC